MMEHDEREPQRLRALAARFADALDRDDLTTAALLLDEAVTQRDKTQERAGRDAVIASLAAASRWAWSAFDDVRRESEIVEVAGATVTVRVTAYFAKAPAQWHRHRRLLRLTFADSGAIVRLEAHEIAGQRDSLDRWLAEIRVAR